MELTEENKNHINSLGYESLLRKWRFASSEDKWIQGETGTYWGQRMSMLRDVDPAGAVTASKNIGW